MALRNLNQTDEGLANEITRLSTGLRINTASDDPAGLIISEGMRSQLKGLDQAMRNSQDAINMSKTAEGALNEVQLLLRNIRGLAVHSANTAVVDSSTLQANQTQIRSTLQSINRIAQQTQFGNKKLLDGTAGAVANVTATGKASSIYVGGVFNGESVVSGTVTIAKVTAATRAAVSLGGSFATATALVTTTGSFVVNGFSFSSSGTETVQSLVNKMNDQSTVTGVTAQLTGSGPVSVQLVSNNYGSHFPITYFDPANVLHNASSANAAGVDGAYNVTVNTTSGLQTVSFLGGRGGSDSGLKLQDNYGNSIYLTESGNSTLTGAPSEIGQITAGSVRFQIGAQADQSVQYSMPTIFANRLGINAVGGKTLADLDVTTQTGSQEAMRIIDDAINQLAQLRGELGSFQSNFLESTVRSIGVAQENLTSSESQIRDADMATEMTNYTRLNILKQSGMSVLAQASQAPQSVLQLLRGQ